MTIDNKSAVNAITSVLQMLPEDERYFVWKQSAPSVVKPNINDNPSTPSGTCLLRMVEDAKILYADLGVNPTAILQYLALALDRIGKEDWKRSDRSDYEPGAEE